MPARAFASDNNAAVHPKVLDAMARANEGHATAYGDDAYTQDVERRIAAAVGGGRAFLVFNGTGANVLALASMLRPYEAVLCAEGAHVAVDECGALERFVGCKVIDIPTPDGKLTPDLVERHLARIGDQHAAQPRVVTVSQSTETGLVYSVEEMRALATFAHANGLKLHVDGARIANAAAALGGDARGSTRGAGVDALSFGFTKNGGLWAEAVVLFDDALAADFKFVRKQGMQLASKMRFAAAQADALLADDLWLQNARHANAMAQLLAREASKVPGVRVVRRVQANAVFARLPPPSIAPLQAAWRFYVWDAATHEARWMCSWDTTEDDVRGFVETMRKVVSP